MYDVTSPLSTQSDAVAECCAVCGHPQSQHDVISTRWCAATSLGVGSRACICAGLVAGARVLNHY